jgi:Tfp pilus assembly protein PilN
MREVDLIPADYRMVVRFIRHAKMTGLGLLVVALLVGSAVGSLKSTAERDRRAIALLQARQRATTEQRQELEGLREQQRRLERRLALLTAIRGGPTAESMLAIIDHAVAAGGVWFTSWRFGRAGAEVDHDADAVHTGYVVVLPPDPEHPEAKEWRVDTHMEIKGYARDHSALSRFVNRLYDHPEIVDARVLNTSVRPFGDGTIVDFDLAVVVAGATPRPAFAFSQP